MTIFRRFSPNPYTIDQGFFSPTARFTPLTLVPSLLLDSQRVYNYSTDLPILKVRRVNEGDEVDIYGYNPSDPRQYKTTSEAIGSAGSELITIQTNRDFSSGLGNWTNVASSMNTFEVVSEEMHCVGADAGDRVRLAATYTPMTTGQLYKLEVDANIVSGTWFFSDGNDAAEFDNSVLILSQGNNTFYFVYTGTASGGLTLKTSAGGEIYTDNYTLKEWTGGYYVADETKLYPSEEFYVVTWFDQSQGSGSELVSNRGFENYTGTQDDAISDTFTSWTNSAVDDGNNTTIEATATSRSGSNALKLRRGTGTLQNIRTEFSVNSSGYYKLIFWTRTDGGLTSGMRYAVRDKTNSVNIIAATNTNINATTYTEFVVIFQAPATCNDVEIIFYPATADAGQYVYCDDVSVKEIKGNHATQTTAANQPEFVWSGATFGSEKVTNGSFTTDTDWSKGTGWTIGSGVASSDGTQTAVSTLNQASSFTNGTHYRVIYNLTARSAGQVRSYINSGGVAAPYQTVVDFYDDILTATSSNTGVGFIADADFVGSVDNLSVKEVLTWNYPVLKPDGIDDKMVVGGDLINGQTAMTMFIRNAALKMPSDGAPTNRLFFWNTGNGMFFSETTDDMYQRYKDNSAVNSERILSFDDETEQDYVNWCQTIDISGGDGKLYPYKNAVLGTLGTALTGTLAAGTDIDIGFGWNGYIKSVVLYQKSLTQNQVQRLNDYYT